MVGRSLSLSLFSFLLGATYANAAFLTARQASATGDSFCGKYMCVSAVKNGSTVQYTLQSQGAAQLGWMAMGFGQAMANSPMIIMWSNSDGNITLSQRTAPFETMPKLDSNPPRVATLDFAASSLTGDKPQFVYTIPADDSTTQNIIWAYSTTNPGSSAEDATIVQHLTQGSTSLDLTKSLSGSSSGTTTAAGSGAASPTNSASTSSSTSGSSSGHKGSSSNAASSLPLAPYQRLIVAHALFSALGFLLLLPAGALLARFLRTYWPGWFQAHWIAQFALAGPVIVIGFALGIQSVSKMGGVHFDDTHKKWGAAIVVLYLAQCTLGAFIHWFKPKATLGRPPQNYAHAVFGLSIIALSFYQVRTGYNHEWPLMTGRGDVPDAVNVVWYIWVVLLPVLYFAGLALLRRQFALESSQSKALRLPSTDDMQMQEYRD